MNVINSYRDVETPSNIFTGATGTFSLINRFDWSDAVILLRRSSDNAEKYVFFDGNTITGSSFVSDTIDTPSATTLSTWIGSDNGFVRRLYLQNETGLIVNPFYLEQTTTSLQFQLITSGTINIVNGYAAMNTLSGSQYMGLDITNDYFDELDNDQEWTVLTVSNDISAGNFGCNFVTSQTAAGYVANFFDRRTQKRHTLIYDGSVHILDLTAQDTSTDLRLNTVLRNSSNFIAYEETTQVDTVSSVGVTYTNNRFIVGVNAAGAFPLYGDLCEIMIFPSDKSTGNLTTIQNQLITDWGV